MNDRIHQQVEVDRLLYQCVETRFHRACSVFGTRIARAGDHRRLSAPVDFGAAQPPDELVAIIDGHADV